MNIKNMKTVKMINGPSDGTIFALIKEDTVYLVTAHEADDAIKRLNKRLRIVGNKWLPRNEKAVLIPGIWEYEMFQFIGQKQLIRKQN